MGARGTSRFVVAATSAFVVVLVALAGATTSAAAPAPWNPLERQEAEADTLYLLDTDVEAALPAGDGGLLAGNSRSGGVLWQPTSTIVPAPGRFRTGLESKGGTHAFAWMPAPDLLPADEFTVEAWFRTVSRRWEVQPGTLLRIGDATGSGHVRLYVGGGNINLELKHQQRASGPVSAQISYPVTPAANPAFLPGVWVNIAFTFKDGTLRLYVNGEPAGSAEVAAPRLWSDTAQSDGLSLLGNSDQLSAGGYVVSDLRISRNARVPGETPDTSAANVLAVDTRSRTGATVNQKLLGVLHALNHLATYPVDQSLTIGTVKVIRTDKMLTATPMIAGPPDATHPTPGKSGLYSYDWQVVDRTLDYFKSAGVEPVIALDATPQILGGSVGPFTGGLLANGLVWQSPFAKEVPNDFTAWSTIAGDLVDYIVNTRGDDVRYWSIWNEPDISGFWTGTLEQYLELYAATAPVVKAVDATLKVGGPDAANWNPEWIEALIKRSAERGLPLDFISWHHYDGSVATIPRARAMVEYWAAQYGIPRPELAVGESAWANHNAPGSGLVPWRDYNYYLNDWNPAYTAAALVEMQRAEVAYSISRAVTIVGERGFRANGLMGPDYPWANLNLFYLWRDLAPNIVTTNYDGRPGVFSIASTGDDGRITVLVSSLRYRRQAAAEDLTIRIPGVGSGRTVTHYVIDAEHSNRFTAGEEHTNLETVPPPAITANGELTISLRPRSVHVIEITLPATEATLSTSASPAEFGQEVTATAEVTSTTTPSGPVELSVDGAPVATQALDPDGRARFVLPALSVGDHTVTAKFLGTTDFKPSDAATVTQSVVRATTATTLEGGTAGPTPYGTPLEFVAAVAAPASQRSPEGAAQLTVDGADFGSPVDLDSSGRARFIPLVPVGTHSVGVRFLGGAAFAPSDAAPVEQVIVPAATTTTLEAAATSFHNAPLVLTARVAPVAPSAAGAAGVVEFRDGGALVATENVADGVAKASLPALSIGTHTIVATYVGSGTHDASTSAAITHAVSINTSITLTVSQSRGSEKVKMRAAVTNFLSTAFATGTVDFYVDGRKQDGRSLSSGLATLNDNVYPGLRTFTARYRGNTTTKLDPAGSAAVKFTVIDYAHD